jgi:hypothetical protein
MPLFGVWLDDAMYFTAGPNTQKAVNLARNAHCVAATAGADLDLIVEGEVERVCDPTTLRRVADAYDAKYGWPLTIRSDGAFDAPYSAPSAGPPPYLPHRLTPTTAFGLGMKEPYGATRWRFSGDLGGLPHIDLEDGQSATRRHRSRDAAAETPVWAPSRTVDCRPN